VEASTRQRLRIVQLAWDLALISAIAVIGGGGWFAFMAWKFASMGYGVAAVLAMLVGPAAAVAVVVARQDTPRAGEETPAAALVEDIHRTESALRLIKLGRAHVGVVSSYVVVLWICEASGMIALGNFLVFFTCASAVTAVAYLPWLSRLEHQQYEKRAAYQNLLGELEAGAR
jgi:hypothetical protein